MLMQIFKPRSNKVSVPLSELYNEKTFYKAFEYSIGKCQEELIIESPFMTIRRAKTLFPALRMAKKRGVSIIINTRDPLEHDDYLKDEAEQVISLLQGIDIPILFTGKLHRKLAIIDRKTLWEGSLNILSQNDSCEIMRKTDSRQYVHEAIEFTGLNKFIGN